MHRVLTVSPVQLQEAYRALSDPESRQLFDMLFRRRQSSQAAGGSSKEPYNGEQFYSMPYEYMGPPVPIFDEPYPTRYTEPLDPDYSIYFRAPYDRYDVATVDEEIERFKEEKKKTSERAFEAKKTIKRQEMNLYRLQQENEGAEQQMKIRNSRVGRLFRGHMSEEKKKAFEEATHDRLSRILYWHHFLSKANKALDAQEPQLKELKDMITYLEGARRHLFVHQGKLNLDRYGYQFYYERSRNEIARDEKFTKDWVNGMKVAWGLELI